MKVLVVYGGANNGLKKEIVRSGLHTSGSKLTNVKNLNPDCQFYINTINTILKTKKQKAAGAEV